MLSMSKSSSSEQSVININDLYTMQHRSHLVFADHQDAILTEPSKPYRLTPFIVTFSKGVLTEIDVQNFIEMGLRIVRFRTTSTSKSDKIKLIRMLKNAVKWCCEKYEVSTWPIAISIDVPNACIRTGYLKDEILEGEITIKANTIVELTAHVDYWNKCDDQRIFIDDPFTIKLIKPGTEICISFGVIVMVCTEVIDSKTVKCKVTCEGVLVSNEFVCTRGIKKIRPALTKRDLELIEFAKEFESDILTMNSVRYAITLKRVRKLFSGTHMPLLMSTICEQEGLDNIDAIIQLSLSPIALLEGVRDVLPRKETFYIGVTPHFIMRMAGVFLINSELVASIQKRTKKKRRFNLV